MRKEPKNEEALCKTVVRLIAERRRETIIDAQPVDTIVRDREAVEFYFDTPSVKFAIEHTRIESFQEQIYMGKRFASLLEPLETELSGQLPGQFILIVDVGATAIPTVQHVKIRDALSEWILANAYTLDAEEEVDFWERSNCSLTAKLPSVPFNVTLHRDTRYGSRLFLKQCLQNDHILSQRECIRAALDRKCPKLMKEQQSGHMSVLILETDDIALANRRVIVQETVAELSSRADAPDIVVWARTSTHPWKAWFIKEGSLMYPDIEGPGPFVLGSAAMMDQYLCVQ